MTSTTAAVFVSWPSAPLTKRLVLRAIKSLTCQSIAVIDRLGKNDHDPLIQWSSYDEIDHELTSTRRQSVLASSYTFRKALIRKHYLAHSILLYITKYPSSVLKTASPETYGLEISFADELDEILTDELYELGHQLENNPEKWWILKPFVVFVNPLPSLITEQSDSGMADRGMGIRLFNTRAALEQIFLEFESAGSDSGETEDEDSGTAVVTSQLRHFVIQVKLEPFGSYLRPHPDSSFRNI